MATVMSMKTLQPIDQTIFKKYHYTEEDLFVYGLKTDNPDKKFYLVDTVCEGLNEITLIEVRLGLERITYSIRIQEKIRLKAKSALDKMLTIQ